MDILCHPFNRHFFHRHSRLFRPRDSWRRGSLRRAHIHAERALLHRASGKVMNEKWPLKFAFLLNKPFLLSSQNRSNFSIYVHFPFSRSELSFINRSIHFSLSRRASRRAFRPRVTFLPSPFICQESHKLKTLQINFPTAAAPL